MSTVSSGLTLTTDFYLRNFYKSDNNLSKATYRTDFSNVELNYEDAIALKRAASKISDFTFSEDDNTESVANSVKAFAKTFNYALSSASSDSSMKRYAKQLKSLSSKYSDQLSDLGLEVESDGSLSVNSDLISLKEPEDFEELFGEDSSFTKTVASLAKKIQHAAYGNMYYSLTGAGSNVNLEA